MGIKDVQSWSKSGNFMIFSVFAIFNQLHNFVLRAVADRGVDFQPRPSRAECNLFLTEAEPSLGINLLTEADAEPRIYQF